ncbi:MAG: geranylgeranylglycerol-phosphate geranylgeranyltransferase [Sphingobacteriaceae bacterium]|nr:geranylgeranylglycerol-phosphate geranylgeranyltransferase [Sphingobacteriaceae bacterium]
MTNVLNNKFFAFLKLIRLENLVIVILTQTFLHYLVFQKIFTESNIPSNIYIKLFGLIVISTVLIAAAGYIINDYFDVKTDLINHPETVVLDKTIKRRWAIILHITFTALGILLGMYTALKTGYLRLALFHILTATALWFYSTHFKKQLLVGNIVVSLLTASVPFITFVFEIAYLQKTIPEFAANHIPVILTASKITLIFCVFSFITSLAREIIKDMEDLAGDKATGGKTMPITWGIQTSKTVCFFLISITIILLLVVIYNTIKYKGELVTMPNMYILFGLVCPLITLLYMVVTANNPKHFKHASVFLKFIMFLGIGYCWIFYF